MKKILLAATLAIILASTVLAGVAVARDAICTSYPCYGTNNHDALDERRGDGTPDKIIGENGRDNLYASRFRRDRDRVFGNEGNDTVSVMDYDSRDKAVGGAGRHDRCLVDDRSEAGGGCNKVVFPYGE
jgi:hypothetical protein